MSNFMSNGSYGPTHSSNPPYNQISDENIGQTYAFSVTAPPAQPQQWVPSSGLEFPTRPGPPPDAPRFKTLGGMIISLFMLMLVISLFITLGRCDFNFMCYLMGYYLWCLESTSRPPPPSYDHPNAEMIPAAKTVTSVRHLTIALAVCCLVDVSWLFLAFSTWECNNDDITKCFSPINSRMIWTYSLHLFVLYASSINLFLKAIVGVLSLIWLQKQRKSGMVSN